MRISLYQIFVILLILILFFGDISIYKGKLIKFYKKIKNKNRKKGS